MQLRNVICKQIFQNVQYQYYGAGLLSNYDKYPEHRKLIVSVKKSKRDKEQRVEKKQTKAAVPRARIQPPIEDVQVRQSGSQ